ncbi:4-amino-4-deoxy-L-arabinose transferase [Andreprevotia lacus DSM 23236]|uniref:4-amino-4-deoxy-L-arabinose transferase n=1 Tax=Andreprevotia lacus DSM 23236 TaxID=1121001 RepID=A0A1W1XRP3_9NEIS|nr:glycosyltransferase family 39 protein [Andreprevotia lacus]SMC26522.1 4-amino-4-deoxy-L-arabinose transferase [Andreprevotia lacus DSM 23236]
MLHSGIRRVIPPLLLREPVLGFAVIWTIVIWLAYGGGTPYMDGAIDFVKVMDYHSGGFDQLFAHWMSDHPPLKVWLSSMSFHLFGVTARSYSFPGAVFFAIGVIAFHQLLVKIADVRTARIGALLLACDPLFNSIAQFTMTDLMVAALSLTSFAAYAHQRWRIWLAAMIGAVMAKETAALLPAAFILQWLLGWLVARHAGAPRPEWRKLLLPIAALGTLAAWIVSLKLQGRPEWSDWIFAPTGNQLGAFGTIMANIRTGELWNDYAVQNWLHLFVLNFQWVYTLAALFLISGSLWHWFHRKDDEAAVTPALFATPWPAMLLFGSGYALLVLTFQTYTITRYVTPAAVLLLVPATMAISRWLDRSGALRPLLLSLGVALMVVRMFWSVDPVSIRIWGREMVMGQTLYGVNRQLAGNDGLTYNMQFQRIIAGRTRLLDEARQSTGPVRAPDCNWVFPDPRNDKQVTAILGYIPPGTDPTCQP